MSEQGPESGDPWAAATHQGNEREQLRRWARMTFTEKVRWLEQAQRLSLKLEQARREKEAQESTEPGPGAVGPGQ